MIDKNEKVFIIDENNFPLEPQLRRLAHKNGLWHRTTGIWVINDKLQILCQKRSLLKDMKPGFWEAFFGGHLTPNQEYIDNAVKELNEELGVSISEQDLIPYKVFKSDKPTHREFQQVFACKINGDIDSFKFEKEEVYQIKWIDIEDVREILLVKKSPDWVQKQWDREVLNWLSIL